MTRPPFLSGSIWPIHPCPLPDELLSSWMVRIARAYGVPPQSFWHQLASISQFRALDGQVSPRVLEALHRGTRIKPSQIRAMTLASFTEWGLLRIGNHPVIAFCPKCLGAPIPFYRRTWCLEFVTICTIHYVELQNDCPACGALIRLEHVRVNQSLAACHNCGCDLAAVSTSTYEPSDQLATVLVHQNYLARQLENWDDAATCQLSEARCRASNVGDASPANRRSTHQTRAGSR